MDSPRVTWISGASSGIGKALAEKFLCHGESVIATSRSLPRLEILTSRGGESRGRCEILACDVTDGAQVEKACSDILKEFGQISILINCAGVTSFTDFLSTSTSDFDQVVNTNLRGLFLTTKAVLPEMIHRGDGMVINILSFAAKAVYRGSSAYAASKAGAEAMMNVLRAETRDKGIRIVNVFPGAVLTPIWHPQHIERYGHQMMRPEEVANAVYQVSLQPASIMTEEIILRPQVGDLRV